MVQSLPDEELHAVSVVGVVTILHHTSQCGLKSVGTSVAVQMSLATGVSSGREKVSGSPDCTTTPHPFITRLMLAVYNTSEKIYTMLRHMSPPSEWH